MESKIQKSLIRTNIKNILPTVMVINQNVLMRSSVGLSRHTYAKTQYTILLFFLTAQNLRLFGQKLQHFSNDVFQSYNDLFQVN